MKYIKLFEDYTDYADYKTAIIAVFNQDNQVLVLQRGSTAPWMPDAWSLVGGGIDSGESPAGAVERECVEEIGIIPANIRFVKKLETQDIGEIYYFVGEMVDEEIQLDWENQAYKFVSQSELRDIDFVPYVLEFLQEQFATQGQLV